MMIRNKTKEILNSISNNIKVSKKDFLYLLNINENSFESQYMKSISNTIYRNRNSNAGLILGQISVETGPCDGSCKFCSFGEGHTQFESI